MKRSSELYLIYRKKFYDPYEYHTVRNEENKLRAFDIKKITRITKLINLNAQQIVKKYELADLKKKDMSKDEVIFASDICFRDFDDLFKDIINNIVVLKTLGFKRQAQKYPWITFDNEVRDLKIKYYQIDVDEKFLRSRWYNLLNSYFEKSIKKIELKNKLIDKQLKSNISISLSNLRILEKIVHEIYEKGGHESIELHPALHYAGSKITVFYSKKEQWVDEIEINDETIIYRKVKLSSVKKIGEENQEDNNTDLLDT